MLLLGIIIGIVLSALLAANQMDEWKHDFTEHYTECTCKGCVRRESCDCFCYGRSYKKAD